MAGSGTWWRYGVGGLHGGVLQVMVERLLGGGWRL